MLCTWGVRSGKGSEWRGQRRRKTCSGWGPGARSAELGVRDAAGLGATGALGAASEVV